MLDVCALGELLIDFTDAGMSAHGQRLFEQNAGGAPANVLVALQRLGHKTALLGKVGTDMHGAYLKETLEREGVDCSGLLEDPDVFTTLAFVALSPSGERSFSFARKPGADTALDARELNREAIRDARVFHIGSLSLTDEPARTATLEALAYAKSCGCTISFDPNYRESLWPSAQAAAEQMRAVAPYAQLIKISQEETELLCGQASPEAAADALLDGGAAVVCVTLDSQGAYVATRKGADVVPSFACEPCDTTGAGDSFWGGFLAAWLEGGCDPAYVTLTQAKNCARFGNAVASLCVRKRGAIPSMPTRAQVEALLGSN